jgi:hypothetical protein
MARPSSLPWGAVTNRQRIVLLAIAAVVLIAGVVLAASSGGDDDTTSDEGQTQTQAQNVQTTEAGEKPKDTEKPPKDAPETIRIKAGKPVGGVKTLKFRHGDEIALRFTSDEPGEVHIHGYDQEVGVGPGGAKVVRFKASLEGIFEIEDHESEELLAKLEVRPK